MRRPEDEVVEYLDAIRGTFTGDPEATTRDEITPSSTTVAPTAQFRAFRRFKEHRLHRVSLGVESGDPTIRRLYGKSWADRPDRCRDGHQRSELALGLVVLAGAGGEENAEAHVEATAGLMTSLGLDEATSSPCSTPRRSASRGGDTSAATGSFRWPANDCPINTRRSRAVSSRSGPGGGKGRLLLLGKNTII